MLWLKTMPDDGRVRAVCARLERHNKVIDESINALRREGFDLSVTAAQRRLSPVGAQAVGGPAHWWWRLEAPCYVSGGNPIIF